MKMRDKTPYGSQGLMWHCQGRMAGEQSAVYAWRLHHQAAFSAHQVEGAGLQLLHRRQLGLVVAGAVTAAGGRGSQQRGERMQEALEDGMMRSGPDDARRPTIQGCVAACKQRPLDPLAPLTACPTSIWCTLFALPHRCSASWRACSKSSGLLGTRRASRIARSDCGGGRAVRGQ